MIIIDTGAEFFIQFFFLSFRLFRCALIESLLPLPSRLAFTTNLVGRRQPFSTANHLDVFPKVYVFNFRLLRRFDVVVPASYPPSLLLLLPLLPAWYCFHFAMPLHRCSMCLRLFGICVAFRLGFIPFENFHVKLFVISTITATHSARISHSSRAIIAVVAATSMVTICPTISACHSTAPDAMTFSILSFSLIRGLFLHPFLCPAIGTRAQSLASHGFIR